jgi:glycosyltransferase involved in cell wall biosynthesis
MTLLYRSASRLRAPLGVVPGLGGSLKEMARHGQLDRLLDYYVAAWLERFPRVRFFSFEPERIEEHTDDIELRRRVELIAPTVKPRRRVHGLRLASAEGKHRLRECAVVRVLQAPGGIVPALAGTPFVCTYGYSYPQFTELPFNTFAAAAKPFKRAAMRIGLHFVLKRAQATIVTSRAGETEARKLGARRVERIPNGVDVDLFAPSDEPKEWDVVFVGRLAPQKDLPTLLDAAGHISGIRLAFAGDGLQREELAARASSAGLDLSLLGTLPNAQVASVVARSRCFVLPSRYEGHPKALLEAMACGVPCIGSRIAGIAELADDGAVITFEPGDASALAEALHRVLEDDELATRLATRGRTLACESFDLKALVRRETELLDAIARAV